jgi:oxygen-dependent protoporphyrinogen oxidase
VAVVGGGITGLAAAHRLTEAASSDGQPLALTVLEAGDRLGGTIRSEHADGFLLEGGPDSLLSEKPWALALAERLGLGPRLVGTDDRCRRTYVVRQGRLVPLPDGFLLLGPTRAWPVLTSPIFSWRGKARMALDLVLPRGPAREDESLGHFVRRRLGREVLERVAQPLVGGIYTADPDRLSLAATMPRFLALERDHGSVIRGLRRSAAGREASGARWSLFVTLAGGMQELVEALAARLPAGTVRLRSPVAAVGPAPNDPGGIARGADAAWRLHLAGGGMVPADGVVLGGEAPRMAGLVRDLDPELARLLGGITYASSAAVSLAYPRTAIRHPLDGFGFIVPRIEGRPSIACTFASVKYPGRAPAGFVLLRVFLGGALRPEVLDRDDAGLVQEARDDVRELLGIAGEPILHRVWRHPAAMPQYEVGHLGRVRALEARLAPWPGLALAGAAYRGVGIADCVRSGEAAADQLWSTLKGRIR